MQGSNGTLSEGFKFRIVARNQSIGSTGLVNVGLLISDSWDDWFEFSTLFKLVVYDREGSRNLIGAVKFGQFDLKKGEYYYAKESLPKEFEYLPKQYFSLGQDDTYFDALNNLGDEYRDHILGALNEISVDDELYERAIQEKVTKVSLLRAVSQLTIREQYQRLARGEARLTNYNFSYELPKFRGSKLDSPIVDFSVVPESQPPTNLHVLIGRNGVGKTHLLRSMIRSLLDKPSSLNGKFSVNNESTDSAFSVISKNLNEPEDIFSSLVSVTFSAFDPFENFGERKDASDGIRYSYIGLQRPQTKDGKQQLPKSTDMLANEFVRSALACLSGGRKKRWQDSITFLEYDELIEDSNIKEEVLSFDSVDINEEEWGKRIKKIFSKFSSGHSIVLLSITKLVELVDEKTLVLMDEPEAYLHPPLLSAFIRAISSLLINRNGVGILATHSPVVLQEVPDSCVWKVHRSGQVIKAEKPEINTFGENIGTLTRDVFGLEVTHSGFHKLIAESVNEGLSFEQIEELFKNQLGKEAQGIGIALTINRDRERD